MLLIHTGGMFGTETQWHVGDSLIGTNLLEVELVQADGAELDYILNRFTGIPKCDARVQVWTGDHAQFIVANLLVSSVIPDIDVPY